MSHNDSYYQILGVDEKADEKEIKAAYRGLARRYHPDVNPGDKAAEEKFKQISIAYDTLSNKEKRAAYDGERRAAASPPPRATTGRSTPRAGPAGMSFDTLFEDLFAGRPAAARAAGASPGGASPAGAAPAGKNSAPRDEAAAAQRLDVSLEEAFKGATRTQTVVIDAPCPECRGTGVSQSGRVGLQVGTKCLACQGAGRKKRTEEVTVTIPAGIYEGAKLRLKNKGPADSRGNRGDLLFSVRLRRHERFERVDEGNDLALDTPLPYTVLVLGGAVEVETLAGKRTLVVPPGTQAGQVLRLPGLGLPGLRERPPGDLLVRVKTEIPRKVSGEERRLLLELAHLRGDPVQS